MNGIIVGARQKKWSWRPQAKQKLYARKSSRAAFRVFVSCQPLNTPRPPSPPPKRVKRN